MFHVFFHIDFDDIKEFLLPLLIGVVFVGLFFLIIAVDILGVLLGYVYQWRFPIAAVICVIDFIRVLINLDSKVAFLIRWVIIFAILFFVL